RDLIVTGVQTCALPIFFSTTLTLRDAQEIGDQVEEDAEHEREQIEQRQRNQDAFGAHALSLLRNAQAGPEPSPVLDQIVDPPDGEDRVHDEEPFVDDPPIAADLPLRVLLDLSVSRVALR